MNLKRNLSGLIYPAIITLLLLITGPSALHAQLSPEDVANIQHVGEVVMQPRGNHVAYTLRVPRQADEEIGGDYSEVRVLDLETGDISHVITRPGSASSLSWVPGTNRIAFRTVNSEHHDRPQIYSMDVIGGDLRQHTSAGGRRHCFQDPERRRFVGAESVAERLTGRCVTSTVGFGGHR